MAASTAPAARTKVLELLAASAALDGVRVMRGPPTEETDLRKRDLVWLGSTKRTVEPIALGGQRFDEVYGIEVQIRAFRHGDDEAACENHGWALVDGVEQAVRADLALDGVLNQHAEFGEQTLRTDPTEGGWVCTATVTVVCNARI